MPAELLTIGIPTRNRSALLRRLLDRLANEIERHGLTPEQVRIEVSDNASTDDTADMVASFLPRLPHLSYSRNVDNVGGDPNILSCPRRAQGTYCWIIGDDDQVMPGTLPYLIQVLETQRPALFIHRRTRLTLGPGVPPWSPTFQAFTRSCAAINPFALIAHTLITANVFLTAAFDHAFAQEKIGTHYGHMYGLARGLKAHGGGVYVTARKTIAVTESARAPVDGIWPDDLEGDWRGYLAWLKEEFDLADLRPDAVGEYRAQAIRWTMRRHPVQFALQNLRVLGRPGTYREMWKVFRS